VSSVLRPVGWFALPWLLAGCTEQVVLDDSIMDASAPEVPASRDVAAGPGIDPRCVGYAGMTFSPRAARLIISLDRSSTMQGSFAGTTREKATIDALSPMLEKYQYRVKFGYEQFPADSADVYADCRSNCCAGPVRVPPQYRAAEPIRAAFKCGETGWNPCPAASYDSASNAALEQVRNFYYSQSDRNDRYVLLVTAAEPSCATLSGSEACAKALDAADGLGNLGAQIMVLSVGYQPPPGSCLGRISRAGSSLPASANLATLHVATQQDSLNDYVRDLSSSLAETACTLDAFEPPPAWAQVIVSIDRLEIPQVDSSTGNGWSFANSARTTIRLSGTACRQYLTSPTSGVFVGYYCSKCGGSNACPRL
jgi:hypothetical protein